MILCNQVNQRGYTVGQTSRWLKKKKHCSSTPNNMKCLPTACKKANLPGQLTKRSFRHQSTLKTSQKLINDHRKERIQDRNTFLRLKRSSANNDQREQMMQQREQGNEDSKFKLDIYMKRLFYVIIYCI